jgi:hypothetical protein
MMLRAFSDFLEACLPRSSMRPIQGDTVARGDSWSPLVYVVIFCKAICAHELICSAAVATVRLVVLIVAGVFLKNRLLLIADASDPAHEGEAAESASMTSSSIRTAAEAVIAAERFIHDKIQAASRKVRARAAARAACGQSYSY